MESAEAKVVYSIDTKVAGIQEEFGNEWLSGVGQDAIFHKYSKGWFVHFEGSHEKLFLGKDKPTLEVGDLIEIFITRVVHAKSR